MFGVNYTYRTPLNCVIGMSSLLADSSDLTPQLAESMNMISSSGELLLTIVNDVLDYSKLESGNVDIQVKRSKLQDAISATVHSMNLKGAARNVSVVTNYGPRVPEYITTDIRRLSQVLYNLIGNALKFSRVSQSVEFSISICEVDAEPPGPPTNQSSSESSAKRYSPPRVYNDKILPPLQGKIIRFMVKDYGRGINVKDLPKIFRPFLQADHETESLYGGTGLGLVSLVDLCFPVC